MNEHEALIHQFYKAFQALDADAMKACYHPDIQFSDPAFPALKGAEAGAMWSMLTDTLKKSEGPWKLTCSNIMVKGNQGTCRWEAHYVLSLTGRKIHNIIDARFEFRDGKIYRHTDDFDFYRWARMAFGWKGMLLGWTSFFRAKVQGTVAARLRKFMERV
jgi:ketosteroid isomerase-like protein